MSNKVLLIVVDGMRADSIPACEEAAIRVFFEGGCYSYTARTVFPPVTLPCHMSLFHSVDPQRHGVCSNTYVPQNHPIDGLIERLTAAGKTTAFFYMWEQLRDLCTAGKHLSYSWFMSWHAYKALGLDWRAMNAAKAHIQELAPDFVFLYLGETDEAGHKYGWMSPEYLAAVGNAHACIAHICASLPADYSVIVTADHGGHDRMHGENIPEDMTIPIAFRGAQFPSGKELEGLSIKDIAPTILDILGLSPEPDWEGQSILRSRSRALYP